LPAGTRGSDIGTPCPKSPSSTTLTAGQPCRTDAACPRCCDSKSLAETEALTPPALGARSPSPRDISPPGP
jgi:hypothetical protein